jgi:hypothetical protein
MILPGEEVRASEGKIGMEIPSRWLPPECSFIPCLIGQEIKFSMHFTSWDRWSGRSNRLEETLVGVARLGYMGLDAVYEALSIGPKVATMTECKIRSRNS